MIHSKTRKQIFKEFRLKDDSCLFPIKNKFNATNRAIGRLYKFESSYGQQLEGLELELWLDNEISNIVNDPKNL